MTSLFMRKACFLTASYHLLNFLKLIGIGVEASANRIKIQCFPLYTVLLALGNPTVNYFSLDIEGAEFKVLSTLPFDKVDVKVWTIETGLLGKVFDESPEQLNEYMGKNGYITIIPTYSKGRTDFDTVYVKKEFFFDEQ